MFKRKVSLFLMVVFLVGMMAVTAYAAGFSLSFDFVNDTDYTPTVTNSSSSSPYVMVSSMSSTLRSVKLEVINALTGEVRTATARGTGTYNFAQISAGGCYVKGTAISGYGYMAGTWEP